MGLGKVRYLYQRHWTEIVTSGHSLEVRSERVKPGKILHVHSCYLHVPESAKNDVVAIYLVHGAQRHVLRSRARDQAKQGMSVLLPFHVGEHQYILGYAPDADVGDEITLGLCGAMMELKKWIKGKV